MKRYAPTLLIGIGGSGIAVLRMLKAAMVRRDGSLILDKEPVVFLGIDLDKNSQYEARTDERLARSEEHYFNPDVIENAIRNLNRQRQDGDQATYEFEPIRTWFPAGSDAELRGAHVAASGARQWRPLGRVGFFQHAREILKTITDARTELDRRSNKIVGVGDQPVIYLVGSLAGGTGSGMLHDIAVNLRKENPGVPLFAFCVLPEVFAMHTFVEKIEANSYAALVELAHLKNQHIIFDAAYPQIRPITASDSIVPYQRIYLLNAWAGKRRPFKDSRDIYPQFADLILLSMSPEMRADTISTQANAAGDSGRPLTDPASKNVFSEMSAMGIHLLSYHRLAEQTVYRFAEEIIGSQERSLLDILTPAIGDSHSTLASWAKATVAQAGSEWTAERLLADLAERFPPKGAPKDWTTERLQEAVRQVGLRYGDGSRNRPGLLDEQVAQIRAQVDDRVSAEQVRRMAHTAYRSSLEDALGAVSEPAMPEPVEEIPQLTFLPEWLNRRTSRFSTLAVPTLPGQLEDAREAVRTAMQNPEPYARWARYEAARVIRDRLRNAIASSQQLWSSTIVLCETVVSERPNLKFDGDRRRREEALFLDCRNALPQEFAGRSPSHAPPTEVLVRRLEQLTSGEREDFIARFGEAFRKCALMMSPQMTMAARLKIADDWVDAVRSSTARLGTSSNDDPRAPENDPFRLLSPELFFSEKQVSEAVEGCRTPMFQEGRVRPSTSQRTVRVLVPPSFAGHERYEELLREICSGVFHVQAQRVTRGVLDEERITVLVENLFHAGEEIFGIYEYERAYAQKPNRALFHVDRRWIPQFEPLINRSGRQDRVSCGNEDCKADIRDLSGVERFCPGCHSPIRNRCGNSGCPVDDLAMRSDLDKIIASRRCPGCKRRLLTYWWECQLHGDVPMDKSSCPICVAEMCAPHESFWRPDLRSRFVCPCCKRRGHKEPFTLAGAETRWLRSGVNGQEVWPAIKYFRNVLANGQYCPQCGTLLAPYCPFSEASQPLHFLFEDGYSAGPRRFRCYLHIHERFYTCGICHFPVPASEIKEGSIRCRRCETDLQSCRFCTPALRLLLPKAGLDSRCPNCHSQGEAWPGAGSRPADGTDLFCSNIYGCSIGAHLMEATMPSEVDRCPICASRGPRLLEVQTRDDHIRACRFCTRLFDWEGGSDSSPHPSDSPCCLCGQRPSVVAALLARDEAQSALTLARAIMKEMDDDAAFALAYDTLSREERMRMVEHVRAFIGRIAQPQVLAVARRRLQPLADHWVQQFGCRTAGGAHARPAEPTDTQGHGPRNQAEPEDPIPQGILDAELLLAHENDIEEWVRVAKRTGVRIDSLPAIQAVLEEQRADSLSRRRIATILKAAEEIWESINDF
jgi:Tubulin like